VKLDNDGDIRDSSSHFLKRKNSFTTYYSFRLYIFCLETSFTVSFNPASVFTARYKSPLMMASNIAFDNETKPNHDIQAPSDRNSASLDMAKKPGEPHSPDEDTDLETGLPQELVWDSPEDPGNARNWSTIKKVYHTAIPALYGFVM
jgi:hypothetical protein